MWEQSEAGKNGGAGGCTPVASNDKTKAQAGK